MNKMGEVMDEVVAWSLPSVIWANFCSTFFIYLLLIVVITLVVRIGLNLSINLILVWKNGINHGAQNALKE